MFALGLYLAERAVESSPIQSFGTALSWGVAAFSTAGIAEMPSSARAQTLGAVCIPVG